MGKQVLRIESIHSLQAFSAKYKHNYRIGNVPNANKEYSHLNEQIIQLPAGETYNSFFERKIMEEPYYETHKVHKNATLGYEVMFSYGTKDLPEDFSIQKWTEKSKEFLIDQFGRDNIASMVLHMDEGTPHIHAIVIPIKDGKLSARSFLPDRQAMRDMHVKYYEYTKEVGLEPENKYIHIEHNKLGMFYANINQALEEKLPDPENGETLAEYSERMNSFYKQQCLRMLGKDHQIKQLTAEKKALEKANQTIEKIIEKKYETQIKKIMKNIGSVENAVHAIRYRDNLQKGIEWAARVDPELAENVTSIITQVQQSYEKAMLQEQEMAPQDDTTNINADIEH